MKDFDRRSFLKISGAALGIGVLYQVAPLASAEASETFRLLGRHSGEAVTPFSFVQLSDAHVGFNGPPDPLGTKAFERAVEMVNALPHQPDLVLFTGDLTHDSEDKDVHAKRMANFREIAGRLKTKKLMCVPGEHDAGLDGGALFRDNFGPSNYSFDHRGVHFIALDNVSRAKPEVGPEQLAWLKKDLARFSKSAPIVVFTHRPLFDLKPEWEWFTSDGDDVMNALARLRERHRALRPHPPRPRAPGRPHPATTPRARSSSPFPSPRRRSRSLTRSTRNSRSSISASAWSAPRPSSPSPCRTWNSRCASIPD